MRYLTEDELILLNKLIIRKYSPHEKEGVLSPGLLNSAVNRPGQSVSGEDAYKTIFDKAAALFESLAQNHAFHNANKIVAFIGMALFLRYNNHKLAIDPEAAVDFTMAVIGHKYKLDEIAKITEKHSKTVI